MNLLDLVSAADGFEHVVEAAGIAMGGWWTWDKFVKTREAHSRIDATAGLEIIGQHDGHFLAVVIADVKNTGGVRHFIQDMRFDLRVLRHEHPIAFSEKAMGQVDFPDELYSAQRFFPEEWVYSFIEPGHANTYRYSVALPLDAKFVLLKVWVVLPGTDEFASSWRVIAVPR